MFFMMGITNGRKDFDFHQMVICKNCGRYGSISVFMTYTVLSLFFIPCFKWNRQYFAVMSCCGKTYALSQELGRKIARGEDVNIGPDDLEPLQGWNDWNSQNEDARFGWNYRNEYAGTSSSAKTGSKRCEACGYTTDEDFEFCPKCGKRF